MALSIEVETHDPIYNDMPHGATIIVRNGEEIISIVEVYSRKITPEKKGIVIKADDGMFGTFKFEQYIPIKEVK